MDEGLLSLRWNDHGLSIFNMLSNIRKNESFCDVTLTCDGFFYPVHKFVLSTCSDFFYQIFEKTPCKHPVIIIANVNRKDLEALLNYMYLGEVSVFRTELKSLVKAAEILKIKGLAEQTENSPVKEKRSSSSETDQPESKRTKSEDYFSVYIKQKESERSHVKNSNSKSKILDSNALNDQDRKDSEVTIDDSLDSVGEFVSAEVSESRRTESSSESNQDPPEVKVEDIFVKEELSDSWYEDAEAGMEDYQYGNPETGLSYDTPQTTFHDNGASWELATAQAQATEGGLPSRVPGPSRLQGMASRDCKYPADAFCYVCGEFIKAGASKYSVGTSARMCEAYNAYFGIPVGNQDKVWVPHFTCELCKITLEGWYRGENISMKFAVPRIWREPTDHSSNCFFCMVKPSKPRGGKNAPAIIYPDLLSAIAPVPHCLELPVPIPLKREEWI
ncbi:zinc finger and BTB domain-containing protein 14-like isoform X3 [Penaeus japonicus]|uniref:zinc finger and BTB domain-containing protein 14-like isoform X3 n=1 Tax=Penaeus japonicus TaxID=27405 RepID=UPI001C70E5A5|nr:zinc finger and BTB domain-containing protein 14-like isoform X3 [Penaeus japonicus]